MHFLLLFCPGLPSLGTYMQSSDDIISTMAPVNGPITHYAPPYLNSCWDEVRSISLFNMFQISQVVLRDWAINSNVSLPWISQSSRQTWIHISCSTRDNVGSRSDKMHWIFVNHDIKGRRQKKAVFLRLIVRVDFVIFSSVSHRLWLYVFWIGFYTNKKSF